MTDRYYIRKSGLDAGWVYIHKENSYADQVALDLFNEIVPGDQILRAKKSDFQEISFEVYEAIIDSNSKGQDTVETIKRLVPGIF
ncbi:hypothetical protein [Paenibacillus sp.]|uniref:hypothetical protein n=1 Tax=Paenibacillus sp. TaxID=58172 RepID=UPI003562106B